MNFISKWFWKRAIRHEMLSASKTIALVAGLLLIVSGLLDPTSLVLGVVLGAGIILLSGRLKHRVWSAGFLIVGLVALSIVEGFLAQGGAALVILAGALGLASTFI